MTLTALIVSNLHIPLLVIGVTLLNWIFTRDEAGDFVLMIITSAMLYVATVWAMLLNYGVESL